MKYIFILLSFLISLNGYSGEPINCSPVSVKKIAAQVFTVKDGSFHDPSVWSNNQVPAETDDVTINHLLTSNNKSVILRGALNYNYQAGGKAGLIFTGIDETKFIDGSVDMMKPVVPQNIGLYVLDGGRLNINGEQKTSWTRAVGSVLKGATSIQVKEAINWRQGDEVFIVATDRPPIEPGVGLDDRFAPKFERRRIKSINGTTITFDGPLQYDHLMVDGQFTAEVGNLTRSFVIGGTAQGRSFIFILSDRPQLISFMELVHTGGGRRTGVYGMHFHMMHDASRGSLVQGVAAHDNNFRVFVPHMSHGITIDNNISFDTWAESLWYDHQQPTHDNTWTNNLIALTRVRPGVQVSESVSIGQGVNNRVNDNVVVYGCTTNGVSNWPLGRTARLDARGGYVWNADNTGDPAEFSGNMEHSNVTGLWWWQNTPHATHFVRNFTSYNSWRGLFIGAYVNAIQFYDSYFYNAAVEFKATSGNTVGSTMVRCVFKTDGSVKYLTLYQDSPIASSESNKIINSQFIGGIGVVIYSPKPDGDPSKQPKKVELIDNTYTGKQFEIHASAHDASTITVNPRHQPKLWGTGTGLKAEYFNDVNFKNKVGERIEPMIRHYSTWDPDKKESPTGPYHKITGDQFSVRFTGQFQPQYNGQHYFDYEGATGIRLWVDNKLILDSWTDKLKETNVVRSSAISLEAGKKYNFKVEIMNQSGYRRAILRYSTSASGTRDIPSYQLYATTMTLPVNSPDPAPNKAPIVSAGPDLKDTTLSFVIEGTATDPEDGVLAVEWTKVSGGNITFQKQTDPTDLLLRDFAPGTYTFRMTVTEDKGLTVSDDVTPI